MKYLNSKILLFLSLFIFYAVNIFAQLPQSKHFKLIKLADGVYAAIASDSGCAITNAGIVDLGDKTLIFNTFINPIATEDLKKAADSLTHHQVYYVVDSDFHSDVIQGNQVFSPEADIISTTWTRNEIEKQEPKEIKWDRENISGQIEEVKKQLENAKDSLEKANLNQSLAYLTAINTAMPLLKIRLPNLTFDHKLTIHGSKKDAELITWGKGYTESDCILNLPQDKIVFAGGLLFVKANPYMLSGYPDEWKRDLRNIDRLNAQIIVPNYGPLGYVQDLSASSEYITALQNLAGEMIANGKTLDDIKSKKVPAPYNKWIYPKLFKENLKFLYKLEKQKINTTK